MACEPPQKRAPLILPGCLLSFLVWLFGAYVAVSMSFGDCFPAQNHSCPTDHERRLQLLWIVLATAALNMTLLVLLIVARARRRD